MNLAPTHPDRLHCNFRSRSHRAAKGFSLVELLVVVAIIGLISGLAVVSFSGARSTYERKRAVSTVMDVVERARLAALQSGGSVYVVMALSRDAGASSDSIMVVGEPSLGSADTGKVLYTKWIRLPKTVRFRSSTDTLAVSQLPDSLSGSNAFPALGGNPTYAAFTFNSTGQIEYPVASNLVLAFYEGMRTSDGTEKAMGGSSQATQGLSNSGLYDVILLSRYTGRVRTEVSSLTDLGIK